MNTLETKRHNLLEKYDLKGGYNTYEAPKDLKNVDSKIETCADKLGLAVSQISQIEDENKYTNDEFKQAFEIILEGVQQKELYRLREVKKGMLEYIEALKEMRVGMFDIEQKFISDTELFEPKSDIQNYIRNRSLFQEPDKILDIYHDKGKLYDVIWI